MLLLKSWVKFCLLAKTSKYVEELLVWSVLFGLREFRIQITNITTAIGSVLELA